MHQILCTRYYVPVNGKWYVSRFGACFTLTMPYSRLAIARVAEEDYGSDGRVRGIWRHLTYLLEAKTEIMCLRTKGMLEVTATFSVEAAGLVYNQTNEFVHLGGSVNHMPTCPSRSTGAYATHGAASGGTPSNCTMRSLRAQNIWMLGGEILGTMLYDCVTWSPRTCHYDTLRRAHHSFLTCCIGWRNNNDTNLPICYPDTFVSTGIESIEAIMRRRWILFAGFMARMEDTETVVEMRHVRRSGEGRGLDGEAGKGLSPGRPHLRVFGVNAD